MVDNKDNLVCSFCGKNQDEVIKLVAGPAVFYMQRMHISMSGHTKRG